MDVMLKNLDRVVIALDFRAHDLGHEIFQHLQMFRWFTAFSVCEHEKQQESLRTETTPALWQAASLHQITASICEAPQPFETSGRPIVISIDADPTDDSGLTWVGPLDTGSLVPIVTMLGWESCERERTCVDCGMTLVHEHWHRGFDGAFHVRASLTLGFAESWAFQNIFLWWWCQHFFTLTDNIRQVLDALQRIQELLHPTDHFCAAALRDGSWHLLHGAHPPDMAAMARGLSFDKRRSCSTAAA